MDQRRDQFSGDSYAEFQQITFLAYLKFCEFLKCCHIEMLIENVRIYGDEKRFD